MCRLFGLAAGREPVKATFWLLDGAGFARQAEPPQPRWIRPGDARRRRTGGCAGREEARCRIRGRGVRPRPYGPLRAAAGQRQQRRRTRAQGKRRRGRQRGPQSDVKTPRPSPPHNVQSGRSRGPQCPSNAVCMLRAHRCATKAVSAKGVVGRPSRWCGWSRIRRRWRAHPNEPRHVQRRA
jgi:hypothetical protein